MDHFDPFALFSAGGVLGKEVDLGEGRVLGDEAGGGGGGAQGSRVEERLRGAEDPEMAIGEGESGLEL